MFLIRYATRKAQESNVGLDKNGIRVTYAYYINFISYDIRTVVRNPDVLLNACEDIVLAVNRIENLSSRKHDVIEI